MNAFSHINFAHIQFVTGIVWTCEPGDGFAYSCVMAGGNVSIHCADNGTSFTDTGYAVNAAPPPESWCQMRVGQVAPKLSRAVRLRVAAVLYYSLQMQYDLLGEGPA